jgi:hypothetical protein
VSGNAPQDEQVGQNVAVNPVLRNIVKYTLGQGWVRFRNSSLL